LTPYTVRLGYYIIALQVQVLYLYSLLSDNIYFLLLL